MTANLEWVRHVLKRRLAEATAPTRELRVSILIQQVADPLDMPLQAAERELTVQRLGLSSTLARRIQSAIERLDNGSFGLCLNCEGNIAPKRLNALVWAELESPAWPFLLIYCLPGRSRVVDLGELRVFGGARLR